MTLSDLWLLKVIVAPLQPSDALDVVRCLARCLSRSCIGSKRLKIRPQLLWNAYRKLTKLSNGTISNDLEWSLRYSSRFQQTRSRGQSATAELLVWVIVKHPKCNTDLLSTLDIKSHTASLQLLHHSDRAHTSNHSFKTVLSWLEHQQTVTVDWHYCRWPQVTL